MNQYILLSIVIFSVGVLTYPTGFALSLLRRALRRPSHIGLDEWEACKFMFRESGLRSKFFWGMVYSSLCFWGGAGGSPLYDTPYWKSDSGGAFGYCLLPLVLFSGSALAVYATAIIKNVAYGKTEVMPFWGAILEIGKFINLLKELIKIILRMGFKTAFIMIPFVAIAYFNSLRTGIDLGWRDLVSIQRGGVFSFVFWSVWFVLLPANLIRSTISDGVLAGINPIEDIRFALRNSIAYVRVLAYIVVYPYITIMPLALVLISTSSLILLCGIPFLIPLLLFYNLMVISHLCGQLGRLEAQRLETI